MWAIVMTTLAISISNGTAAVDTLYLPKRYNSQAECKAEAKVMEAKSSIQNNVVYRFGDCIPA